jgi:hypothetical protein
MKNVRMLILSMIALMSVISGIHAEKIDYTPYVTGNGLDKNGRNIYHIFAINCDLNDFEEQLSELEKVALQTSNAQKITLSVIAIDKNGDTPLTLAWEKIAQSSSGRCSQIARWLVDLQTAELNRN